MHELRVRCKRRQERCRTRWRDGSAATPRRRAQHLEPKQHGAQTYILEPRHLDEHVRVLHQHAFLDRLEASEVHQVVAEALGVAD